MSAGSISPVTMLSGASNTSATRSAAVAVSRAKDSSQPRLPTGQASDSSSVTKVTAAPSERTPPATPKLTPMRTTSSSTEGKISSSVHRTAARSIRFTPLSAKRVARSSNVRPT